MGFQYQAIDASGHSISDFVDAGSVQEAADILRDKGLFVTRLDARDAPTTARTAGHRDKPPGGRFKEVVLFTQQMSMLLRSGAQVIEALEAIEDQNHRPAWQQVIASVRADVQEGHPLSAALARFPRLFNGVYVSMLTAGEASGELGLSFERLSALTRQQQEIRNRVIGAMSYPLLLLLLCLVVIGVMLGFILPRFSQIFEALDVELPLSTVILIESSTRAREHWPVILVAMGASLTGLILYLRSPAGKRRISMAVVRIPLFGTLIRDIITARICRIWGQLLESRVGLLESIELVERGTQNHEFKAMLTGIHQAVTDGERIGPRLRGSWLIPKTYAGAIATGEASGRLPDSLLFAAMSMEDRNTETLASLTRIIEPLILTGMGVVVGTIAFSLFLPMFDMANAAGH